MRIIPGIVSTCLLLIFILANCTFEKREQITQNYQSALPTKTDVLTLDSTATITVTPSPLPPPTLTLTPTPIIADDPLPEFPLSVGSTWVYSSTHYEIDTKTGQKITATYIITEQVISVRIYEPYFTAQIHKDVSFLAGVKSKLARPLLERDFIYIVDNNFVYRQRQSTLFNPVRFKTTRFLMYKFPLLEYTKCWYPELSTEFQIELFGDETCPSWGYRYVDGLIEPIVPAGTFKNCANVIQTNRGELTSEWICPGIGKVGEKMDGSWQQGFDPYPPGAGYEQVLITYTIQGLTN
jgi:hypothetical protein